MDNSIVLWFIQAMLERSNNNLQNYQNLLMVIISLILFKIYFLYHLFDYKKNAFIS
jgi:hypothetical protein